MKHLILLVSFIYLLYANDTFVIKERYVPNSILYESSCNIDYTRSTKVIDICIDGYMYRILKKRYLSKPKIFPIRRYGKRIRCGY